MDRELIYVCGCPVIQSMSINSLDLCWLTHLQNAVVAARAPTHAVAGSGEVAAEAVEVVEAVTAVVVADSGVVTVVVGSTEVEVAVVIELWFLANKKVLEIIVIHSLSLQGSLKVTVSKALLQVQVIQV